MRLMLILLAILFFGLLIPKVNCEIPPDIQRLIQHGEFTSAQKLMRSKLAENQSLTAQTRLDLQFEIKRLDRIKLDFCRNQENILASIREYIPEVAESQLAEWEAEKSLEVKIIDGQKKYFEWAANNLFRINKQAKSRKQAKIKADPPNAKSAKKFEMKQHLKAVIDQAKHSKSTYIHPLRFSINYSLTVKPNIVPAGKIVRCWLPFPRNRSGHQTDIKIISTEPAKYLVAENSTNLQRTLYLEKMAQPNEPMNFQLIFEYTGHARYEKIEPGKIHKLVNPNHFMPYLNERAPHIVFTKELKTLAKEIIGEETNPYLKAKKIYKWIDTNIPWASAREYSTIKNISHYCFENKHGDCGIQTLLFITLARICGIPAKWQSGFTTKPGSSGLHDWGEMYFEPYGWLPVDVSNGLQNSPDNAVHWFYFGNIDAYRLVVNDDYSQPLFPAKIFPRSETVDFQRGEVEWEGGNIYFEQWDWDISVEYLK